ncbi:hypothetical protein MRX96_058541 [Rhipicephalus microplus]
MTSLSPNCKLEKGDISDVAEELGDNDARTTTVPRPPAKPFGIETPLSVFNPPKNHYDRNIGGHSRRPCGGGLRSAVLTRPLAPSRGCASLPSFVVFRNYGRASGADDRCAGWRSSSHFDQSSRFRRSYSGHFSWDNESLTVSSSHGRFQLTSLQRLRPKLSPSSPTSHSGSTRKNRILLCLRVMVQ